MIGVEASRPGDVVERCGCSRRRGLVVFHEDGTCDLAPKAGVSAVAEVPVPQADLVGTYTAVPQPGTASCLRPICRLLGREGAER